jgi:outer membrane protein
MNVNLRFTGILFVLAVIFLAPITRVQAQGTGGAAASATAKVAVLNVRGAIVATAEGKVAQAQLQSQFASRQNDLQSMQKQIEDIQRRMSEGARTLSDDEKAKLQRQGELLTRRIQRGNDDLSDESNAAQGEVIDAIGRKMLDVVDRYARENGLAVVLDTSAQGTSVVYGSTQADITADIVRLYDQAYPVKSGGAPAAAAPKPAPATPAAAPASKSATPATPAKKSQ